MNRTPLVVSLAALFVVSVAVGPGVVAAQSTDDGGEACFPGDGTEFVAGTEGPAVEFSLHTSLFPAVFDADDDGTTTDTTATGALGVEAAGVANDTRIVSLRTGVLFRGSDVGALLEDPFAPFAFVFDYRLTIPAFEGTSVDSEYAVDDAPVSGPVEEAAGC